MESPNTPIPVRRPSIRHVVSIGSTSSTGEGEESDDDFNSLNIQSNTFIPVTPTQVATDESSTTYGDSIKYPHSVSVRNILQMLQNLQFNEHLHPVQSCENSDMNMEEDTQCEQCNEDLAEPIGKRRRFENLRIKDN